MRQHAPRTLLPVPHLHMHASMHGLVCSCSVRVMQAADLPSAAAHAAVLPLNVLVYWQWRLLVLVLARVLPDDCHGASVYAAALGVNAVAAAAAYLWAGLRAHSSLDAVVLTVLGVVSLLVLLLYAYVLQAEHGKLLWLHPRGMMDAVARVAAGWAGGFPTSCSAAAVGASSKKRR